MRRSLLALPLILTVGLALSGCGAASVASDAAAPVASAAAVTAKKAPAATSSGRKVTYSVTGKGESTSITYMTVNGGKAGQAQANGEKLPWKKTIKIKDDGLFESSVFSLVAQAGTGTKKITCKISVDGKVIDKQTSTGQYAVATCSGSAK